MNSHGGIPRSRGAVCGVILVLLALWGGLAPFVGPYLHFGFTPDKAWGYTTGRLYYSIAPGAAALVGGLLVLATRNRGVGVIGGVLAAIGGAWFIVGEGIVTVVLKRPSITVGTPLTSAGAYFGPTTVRTYAESVAFFGGLGALTLFVAAIAVGRFSMLAAADLPDLSGAEDYYDPFAATQPVDPGTGQFPTVGTQFPGSDSAVQYPSAPTEQFPGSDSTVQYPSAPTGQFPRITPPGSQ